jgi:3D (Asp-Asp-Asp) domain-containing protein
MNIKNMIAYLGVVTTLFNFSPKVATENIIEEEIAATSSITAWNEDEEGNELRFMENDLLSKAKEAAAAEERKEAKEAEAKLEYLGVYRLSAYCPCSKCCGVYANGYTASGTKATAGRTIAMSGLPFGTRVMIEGHEYIVEDRGGGLGSTIIDIFFNTHSEALKSGLWYDAPVYIIKD